MGSLVCAHGREHKICLEEADTHVKEDQGRGGKGGECAGYGDMERETPHSDSLLYASLIVILLVMSYWFTTKCFKILSGIEGSFGLGGLVVRGYLVLIQVEP